MHIISIFTERCTGKEWRVQGRRGVGKEWGASSTCPRLLCSWGLISFTSGLSFTVSTVSLCLSAWAQLLFHLSELQTATCLQCVQPGPQRVDGGSGLNWPFPLPLHLPLSQIKLNWYLNIHNKHTRINPQQRVWIKSLKFGLKENNCFNFYAKAARTKLIKEVHTAQIW